MTDLERALLELDKLPTKSQVFAVVAAARREGEEGMRERAAKICDLDDCVRIKASALAADIRALSLRSDTPCFYRGKKKGD